MRCRAQKSETTNIKVVTATIGCAKKSFQGRCATGTNRSSSSLIVKSLSAAVVSPELSGKSLPLITSNPRENELRNCVQRDGIKAFTTRLETKRLFFLALRASKSSLGWMMSEPIARISSLAYPGNFAKR